MKLDTRNIENLLADRETPRDTLLKELADIPTRMIKEGADALPTSFVNRLTEKAPCFPPESRRQMAETLEWTIEWTCTQVTTQAAGALAEWLAGENNIDIKTILCRCAGLIGRFRSTNSFPRLGHALLSVLETPSTPSVCLAEAAQALGHLRTCREEGIPLLKELVSNCSDPIVKACAAYAIARLGDLKDVEEYLYGMVDDEDEAVAATALSGLCMLGSTRIRNSLQSIAEDASRGPEVRATALKLMGAMEHEAFQEALLAMLTDDEFRCRRAAYLQMTENIRILEERDFSSYLEKRIEAEEGGPLLPMLLWAKHKYERTRAGRCASTNRLRRLTDFLEEYAEHLLLEMNP